MITQELLNYIENQLQQGVPKEKINSNLSSQGWQQLDIDDAFLRLGKPDTATQPDIYLLKNQEEKTSKKAIIGLVLGVISILVWVIPLVGAPVAITGLVLNAMAIKSISRKIAIIGTALCSIGLIATIANLSLTFYMSTSGPRVLLGQFFAQEKSAKREEEVIKVESPLTENEAPEPTTKPEPKPQQELPNNLEVDLRPTMIKKYVESSNARISFPYKIDRFTTLTSITAEPSSIRYHAIISGTDTSALTTESLKRVLTNLICNTTEKRAILDYGIGVEYSYSVANSAQTFFISILEADCN